MPEQEAVSRRQKKPNIPKNGHVCWKSWPALQGSSNWEVKIEGEKQMRQWKILRKQEMVTRKVSEARKASFGV